MKNTNAHFKLMYYFMTQNSPKDLPGREQPNI